MLISVLLFLKRSIQLAFFMQTKVNRPYDIRNDLATSILNIVWHMFVGKRFKLGDALLNWMIVSLDKTVTLIDQGGFLNFTPVLQ